MAGDPLAGGLSGSGALRSRQSAALGNTVPDHAKPKGAECKGKTELFDQITYTL